MVKLAGIAPVSYTDLDSIREVAKKNAVGGVEAVSDEDAYRMAEEYYGINRTEKHETMNVLDLL